jgi:hypothetical protein
VLFSQIGHPLPASSTRKTARVSIPLVYFFLRSQCFSWHFPINLLFSQVCWLSSLSRQREYGPFAAIPSARVKWRRRQKWVFLLFYFFPTIPNVFHGNFQLTCCSVSTLPQLTEGIRAHCWHPHLQVE